MFHFIYALDLPLALAWALAWDWKQHWISIKNSYMFSHIDSHQWAHQDAQRFYNSFANQHLPWTFCDRRSSNNAHRWSDAQTIREIVDPTFRKIIGLSSQRLRNREIVETSVATFTCSYTFCVRRSNKNWNQRSDVQQSMEIVEPTFRKVRESSIQRLRRKRTFEAIFATSTVS